MLRLKLVGAFLVLGIALLVGSWFWHVPQSERVSGTAPDFALPADGALPATRLTALRGHVVLLDFWATWCGPCREEIPELVALQSKYGSKGLEVIGVSLDDANTAAAIPDARQRLGINYRVAIASQIPDLHGYDFASIPTLYLIGPHGALRGKWVGLNADSDLDEQVQELLPR
ncbi:MAG: TlpA family protein disulfide reductase [Armatimonadetes bacterium]|nr:TlpA family protein disulfide reductase [Armatimonadota bacterium]MDE2207713.1 TlpA family protein disulfide reductase [Armatimonadota bacterium]